MILNILSKNDRTQFYLNGFSNSPDGMEILLCFFTQKIEMKAGNTFIEKAKTVASK